VKVFLGRKDPGLVLWNALDLVSPLSRNLDGSLDGFGASVHGQHHLEAQHRGDLFGETREHIVVECAGTEGES
jgi:hypothetical protein